MFKAFFCLQWFKILGPCGVPTGLSCALWSVELVMKGLWSLGGPPGFSEARHKTYLCLHLYKKKPFG